MHSASRWLTSSHLMSVGMSIAGVLALLDATSSLSPCLARSFSISLATWSTTITKTCCPFSMPRIRQTAWQWSRKITPLPTVASAFAAECCLMSVPVVCAWS